jgi:hypothetical protein
MHATGELQETDPRELYDAPAGFALGWIVHVVPSQTSINVCDGKPAGSVSEPTASQLVPLVQEIPDKTRTDPLLGDDWKVQLEPSHDSASGWVAVPSK